MNLFPPPVKDEQTRRAVDEIYKLLNRLFKLELPPAVVTTVTSTDLKSSATITVYGDRVYVVANAVAGVTSFDLSKVVGALPTHAFGNSVFLINAAGMLVVPALPVGFYTSFSYPRKMT